MKIKLCIISLSLVLLSGCSPQGVWVKDTIPTQGEIDHYQCLKESQELQGWSNFTSSFPSPYLNGGNNVITTVENNDLYQACMKARGYTFHTK
ncbi:MAG: hypothetical protein KGN31_06840 [Betaproteobacteria bacterium]|nr:hypothetical protein [Betaproteobacteria bacterium]